MLVPYQDQYINDVEHRNRQERQRRNPSPAKPQRNPKRNRR